MMWVIGLIGRGNIAFLMRAGGFLLPALVACGLALFLLRLLIFNSIQFPAPNSDSILFASVANYHCTTGRFETPIFPLDPSGGVRYVWHGVVHPAILSFFSPGCGIVGLYVAQTILLIASGFFAWCLVKPRKGGWWAAAFALVLLALQIRQGFRPETTAMVFLLATDWLRTRRNSIGWSVLSGIQAWLHPTAFIFYIVYVIASTNRDEINWFVARWKIWLPLTLFSQFLLLWAYPFSIADLLQGLALQGEMFAARNDGSLWTYYIRSDFFPLFGLVFLITYGVVCRIRPAMLLLLPLCWYYGFRVPPANYNLLPLWICLMWFLLNQEKPGKQWIGFKELVACSVLLAAAGIAQSVVRDVSSWFKYGSTLTAAQKTILEIENQGWVVCRVPAYFTLIYSSERFLPSYTPQMRDCVNAPQALRRDLINSIEIKNRKDALLCTPWPTESTSVPFLERLFQSDWGYGFYVCPYQNYELRSFYGLDKLSLIE